MTPAVQRPDRTHRAADRLLIVLAGVAAASMCVFLWMQTDPAEKLIRVPLFFGSWLAGILLPRLHPFRFRALGLAPISALVGVIWGNLLGVDVNLSLVGFKVFPVVILGGLDSIPGAVVGGLIVGIVENIAAGYLDPYVGGGTKDFAPYVLMILALMVRTYGIFGKKIIERV